MEIVLASHSYLAKGMYDTATLIMGKQVHLHYLAAYVEEGVDFKKQLDTTIQSIREEKIVFISDVLGGSVNNELTSFVQSNSNYFLIAGMNLPLVLELLANVDQLENESGTQIIKKLNQLIEVGRQGLQVVELNDGSTIEEYF